MHQTSKGNIAARILQHKRQNMHWTSSKTTQMYKSVFSISCDDLKVDPSRPLQWYKCTASRVWRLCVPLSSQTPRPPFLLFLPSKLFPLPPQGAARPWMIVQQKDSLFMLGSNPSSCWEWPRRHSSSCKQTSSFPCWDHTRLLFWSLCTMWTFLQVFPCLPFSFKFVAALWNCVRPSKIHF